MRRNASMHLRLVAKPRWQALCPIRFAYEWALTEAFSALPEIDERAAIARFMELDPTDRVYAGLFGDPIARRIVLFTFGTRHTSPTHYATLRAYVDLLRDARYLIGMGHALDTEGVPLRWTRALLRKFQAAWFAQDASLRGDSRDFDVIAHEIEHDEVPSTKTTPQGEETTQRVRTPFGGVFTCVALDRLDGTKHEDYLWDFPDDVDPTEWRVVVEQATVRHMQLWSRYRRVNDAYFNGRGSITRAMAIRRGDTIVERRPLHAMPNYEPLVVDGASAAGS